jgi:hypothetical protein
MAKPKRLEIPDDIIKRVQIKNIKDNIGHDLMGMFCDIFLDKKNVGYYNDDGYGGGAEIAMEEKDRNAMLELLESHQWRHRMFTEIGWDFYDSESKIGDDSVIESLIEHLYEEKQKEKMMKKIAKQSEKEILYGRWESYTRSAFKGGMTLEQMVRSYGLAKVQDYIDRTIKTRLQEGDEILNTNFEELGLRK